MQLDGLPGASLRAAYNARVYEGDMDQASLWICDPSRLEPSLERCRGAARPTAHPACRAWVFVGMQTAAGQSEQKALLRQPALKMLDDSLRGLPGWARRGQYARPASPPAHATERDAL